MFNLDIRFNADSELTALVFATVIPAKFWSIAHDLDSVHHLWTEQFVLNPAKRMYADLGLSKDPFVAATARAALEGYEVSRVEFLSGRG